VSTGFRCHVRPNVIGLDRQHELTRWQDVVDEKQLKKDEDWPIRN